MDFARTIFAGLIYSNINDDILLENVKKCHLYFKTNVRTNIFKNEYSVFFSILKARNDVFVLSEESLFNIITRNKLKFQASKTINLEAFKPAIGGENTGEEGVSPMDAFISACLDTYTDISQEIVPFEEFKDAVVGYIEEFQQEYALKAVDESLEILTNGLTINRKPLQGYEDFKTHLTQSLMKVDNIALSTSTEHRGYYSISTEEYYIEQTEKRDTKGLRKVTDFGIKELDKSIGFLYSGDMVSLLAPSKGCKSRFTAYMMHRAAIVHKQKVGLWILEGNPLAWTALLRARHFDYFYSREQENSYFELESEHIRKQQYISEEYRQLEYVSFYDMVSNPDYGKISYIDKPCHAKSIIDDIESAYRSDPFDILAIDYLMLMGRDSTRREALDEVYPSLLRLQKKLGFATWLPSQFKQDVVDKLHSGSSIDTRTMAGESYETIKTPDINLGLYATEEELRLGRIKVLNIPSRIGGQFDPFYMNASLGVCKFESALT